MSYDLRDGLAALGAAERSATVDLPVPALRARARRRRAVRMASASGGALLAVGAIAIAAVALPARERPPAAATSTTSPSDPVDAPEWPSAVTLDGAVPACGDPMPATVPAATEPVIRSEAVVPPHLPAGEIFIGDHTVTVPEELRDGLVLLHTEMVTVRDGIVVEAGPPMGGRLTAVGALQLDMVGCDGTPIPAGEYDVYALAVLLRLDAALEPVEDDPLVVVGGPYHVTVVAGDDGAGP